MEWINLVQTGLNPREEVINTGNMFQAGAPSRGRLWGHKPSRVVFETICYVKKSIPIMPNLKILTQKTTEIVFWKVAEAVRKCKDIREYDRLYKKINNNIEEYGRWENCECIIIVGAVPAIRLLSAKEAAATKAHIRTLEKYITLHWALAGSVKYLNIPK